MSSPLPQQITRQSVPGTPPDPHSSIRPELLTRLDLHFATSFLTGTGTVNHSSIWWSRGVAGLYSRTHGPNLSSAKQKTWFPSNNLFCLISQSIPPFISFLRDTTLVKNEGTKATSCSLMVCWPRGSGAFALIAISPYPTIGIQPLPAARDASLIGLVALLMSLHTWVSAPESRIKLSRREKSLSPLPSEVVNTDRAKL
jgi:hypothetical protein